MALRFQKYKRNRVPMTLDSTQLFKEEIRMVLHEMCAEMKPSRQTLNAIMHYAATYELPS